MQTNFLLDLEKNVKQNVDAIIKKCVHCGFCLATCPTYRILGDENNSPRGRIYNIKNFFEGNKLDLKSLDKCLICRSCESTCPSGVDYHNLLSVAKNKTNNSRPLHQKIMRKSLAKLLSTPKVFNSFAWIKTKKAQIKTNNIKSNNKVILHSGCVQNKLSPDINNATVNVLNKLGYEAIITRQKECCSAINYHLEEHKNAIKQIKNNIDNWFDILQNGAENIISNASGCGLMIKDYANILQNDDEYQQKAKFISDKTLDITEFFVNNLTDIDLSIFNKKNITIKYHEPCTMQHGQKLSGLTHKILNKLDYKVEIINDNHLCCGSAGTYSIFEKKLATKLRDNKLKNLTNTDVIVSSNIGCILHLQKGTTTKVKHWIELLV